MLNYINFSVGFIKRSLLIDQFQKAYDMLAASLQQEDCEDPWENYQSNWKDKKKE